jgi:hypothetical protein
MVVPSVIRFWAALVFVVVFIGVSVIEDPRRPSVAHPPTYGVGYLFAHAGSPDGT